MTISKNLEKFHGLEVIDYKTKNDWSGPEKAYRVRTDWDGGEGAFFKILDDLADLPECGKIRAIVIGMWGADSHDPASDVVKAMGGLAGKFQNLTGIFMGDISFEENEISWIHQADITPLINAYPKLRELRVRGGNDLAFSEVSHEFLEILGVETGGLPRSVLRELTRCIFPNLKTLELWLGDPGYGWDGTPEDLQPLLAGKYFPKLESLGICNSSTIDDLAPLIVNAPILEKLTRLDLSKGNLSDVGARSLLELAKFENLKSLDLSHHYMSPGMIEQLEKALKCTIIANDGHSPNEEWRSIYVSE